MTVTDDDTRVGSGTVTVRVDNAVPVVVIDRTTTTSFGLVPTVLGIQNQGVAFNGSVTDPGSDDVSYTWTFGDGLSSVVANLVNPPGTDPAQSPTVQPRSFRVPVSHTYARPCVYRSGLSATDDEGGVATPDGVDVVVLASKHKWGSHGLWKNEYEGRRSISAADLACYLRVVSHLSTVFGPGDPVALSTSAQALAILNKTADARTDGFDRKLLITWLNVANGSLALTTPFDFDRDGRPDLTASQALANAEAVRRNPASTKAQLDLAADRVEAVERFATS